jgi:hypothetical protein
LNADIRAAISPSPTNGETFVARWPPGLVLGG